MIRFLKHTKVKTWIWEYCGDGCCYYPSHLSDYMEFAEGEEFPDCDIDFNEIEEGLDYKYLE